MPDSTHETYDVTSVYLLLAQYPIMARQIRHRMREELYRRRIITHAALEREVQEKAILSQEREGLTNPLVEEDERQWDQRMQQIRDHLTDFYFAYNFPLEQLQHIIEELIAQRTARASHVVITFNPELAPLDFLLKRAAEFEALPPEEREQIAHHLEEMRVVLIKTMISDHLGFVSIAKNWFTAADFKKIEEHRIGSGKVGGKAGGMLLAWKILQSAAPKLAEQIVTPESYYIGADVFYDFLALNGLQFFDQKYKPPAQIAAEYPKIQAAYERGRFPEEIADRLRDILRAVGRAPLIVRSSSRLEDSFGTAFAGKYASYFLPNQGTPKENLRDLTLAIRRIYASVYNPDAMTYRRRMGLLDYDERMAILLQQVEGETYRQYFFPSLAGVAFSYSPIVWNRRLKREEGFVRVVAGLGTRAVERVADDYARLITLSHPQLRPEVTTDDIRHYSQHSMDVIDLKENRLVTLPVRQVLDRGYPHLRLLASLERDEIISPMLSAGSEFSPDQLVVTFDNLLNSTEFVPLLKNVLQTLAEHYRVPVDVEFTVSIASGAPKPRLTFHLLQCRPLSSLSGGPGQVIPQNLPADDVLFRASRLVPQGKVSQIEYIVYVDPDAYNALTDPAQRSEVAHTVGRVNRALEGKKFFLMGPGRWGSTNALLGVPVSYGDIYNARALVELAVKQHGVMPEPSYGTHFFQDLVEAQIYPIALYPESADDFLNQNLLRSARNQLARLLPDAAEQSGCIHVIQIPLERRGHYGQIVMDGEHAVAYLAPAENGAGMNGKT